LTGVNKDIFFGLDGSSAGDTGLGDGDTSLDADLRKEGSGLGSDPLLALCFTDSADALLENDFLGFSSSDSSLALLEDDFLGLSSDDALLEDDFEGFASGDCSLGLLALLENDFVSATGSGGGLLEMDFEGFASATGSGGGLLEKDFEGFASGDCSLGLLALLENDFVSATGSGGGLLEKDFEGFASDDALLEKDFGGGLLEKDFSDFDSLENNVDFSSGNDSIVGFTSLGEGNVPFTNSSSSSSSSSSTAALIRSVLFVTCRGISSKLTRIIVVDSFGLDRIISLISSSDPSLFSNINLILNITSSTIKLNIQFSASSLKESNHSSSYGFCIL
jgi:hypothetical protein